MACLTCTNVIELKMVESCFKLDIDKNVEYFDVEWNNCGSSRSVLLLLLLLLLSSSSSSSSPLCRVFILIFLRQTMSLGNIELQLFCCYY